MKTLEPTHTVRTDDEMGLMFKVELATGLETMICYTCSKPLSQGWLGAGWIDGPRGTFDTAQCRDAWREMMTHKMGLQA